MQKRKRAHNLPTCRLVELAATDKAEEPRNLAVVDEDSQNLCARVIVVMHGRHIVSI